MYIVGIEQELHGEKEKRREREKKREGGRIEKKEGKRGEREERLGFSGSLYVFIFLVSFSASTLMTNYRLQILVLQVNLKL